MKKHPTIIVEHYSAYRNQKNLNISITRKNLYWEPKEAELIEDARIDPICGETSPLEYRPLSPKVRKNPISLTFNSLAFGKSIE